MAGLQDLQIPGKVCLQCTKALIECCADSGTTLCALQGAGDNSVIAALFQSTLLPLAVAAALLFLLMKNGKAMVDRPHLRPELSQPWH